jgi:Tol biopolymer transport system component
MQASGGGAVETPPSMEPAGEMDPPDLPEVPADAGVVTPPIPDCVLGDFRVPEPLTGLEQGLTDVNPDFWAPSLSPDGRTLFFAVGVGGVGEQIASATRNDRGAAFGGAVPVAGIEWAGNDGTPLLSADGLSLYFFSTRAGGLGDRDVWLSTRSDRAADFTTPALVAGVNGPSLDHAPWVALDELTMLFATNRSGGVGQLDIWIARRNFRSDGFSNVAPLTSVNSTAHEGRAVLSNDELAIYFASERSGGLGAMDLWVATRNDKADAFSQVTNLAGLNSSGLDQDPVLSADERELLFTSDRDGRVRLWRSVRDCE